MLPALRLDALLRTVLHHLLPFVRKLPVSGFSATATASIPVTPSAGSTLFSSHNRWVPSALLFASNCAVIVEAFLTTASRIFSDHNKTTQQQVDRLEDLAIFAVLCRFFKSLQIPHQRSASILAHRFYYITSRITILRRHSVPSYHYPLFIHFPL